MTTKKCTKCHETKPENQFHLKSAATGKRRNDCAKCHNKYTQQHYLNNKAKYDAASDLHKPIRQERLRRYIYEYLLNHPCVDCGISDPIILVFDHVTDNKTANISAMINGGYAVETVAKEIAKCEVRCWNCHHKRHQIEWNGWMVRAVKGEITGITGLSNYCAVVDESVRLQRSQLHLPL